MNRILWFTVSDRKFFPGTVAAVNSIRTYHPDARIAVISSGHYNEPLSDSQVQMLKRAGIKTCSHEEFQRGERVLGAWQLKAYAAYDLAGDCDLLIGIDSDAVLCGPVDDIIRACLEDGKFRGGMDGGGNHYGQDYKPYGFTVPVRNPIYMSTSLFFVPMTKGNRAILKEWAACCDRAVFGPQTDRIFPGHGDQGVLNAVIFKHTRSENVELLNNHLWSQHHVYWSDVIGLSDGRLCNHSARDQSMRALHCGGAEKFWNSDHSRKLSETAQSQVWSYAYWLRMLWFGPHSDTNTDPWTWLPSESRHLCRGFGELLSLDGIHRFDPRPHCLGKLFKLDARKDVQWCSPFF